jgi:hypothetical protein
MSRNCTGCYSGQKNERDCVRAPTEREFVDDAELNTIVAALQVTFSKGRSYGKPA